MLQCSLHKLNVMINMEKELLERIFRTYHYVYCEDEKLKEVLKDFDVVICDEPYYIDMIDSKDEMGCNIRVPIKKKVDLTIYK